jgi:MFS family permease
MALDEERRAFAANVWKSYAYTFLMELPLTAPIWVLYLRDGRGFTLTQITLLEVPLFLLITLAEVPTGAVADRFGRKVSLLIASVMLAVAIFVYGVASSYPIILLSNLAWGLAFTFRSGADTALLYDSLKRIGRESDFAAINGRSWALRSTAMLLGLLLGAPLAAAYGYTAAITLAAIVHASAIPFALAMREPREPAAHEREPYFQTLAAGVRTVWQRPALRWLFLFSAVMTPAAVAPLLLFQQPWLAQQGVPVARIGLWQAPVQAAEIIAGLGVAWVLARVGERAAYVALPATVSLCAVALAGVDHAWIAVAFVGMALARGLQNPLVDNTINHRIESDRRATVLSVHSVARNAMMAIAWPLGGGVAEAYGLRAVFLLFGVVALGLGGVTLALWLRAAHDADAPPRRRATVPGCADARDLEREPSRGDA